MNPEEENGRAAMGSSRCVALGGMTLVQLWAAEREKAELEWKCAMEMQQLRHELNESQRRRHQLNTQLKRCMPAPSTYP